MEIDEAKAILAKQLDEARVRNRLQQKCNGRVDCTATHHLIICLSQKEK